MKMWIWGQGNKLAKALFLYTHCNFERMAWQQLFMFWYIHTCIVNHDRHHPEFAYANKEKFLRYSLFLYLYTNICL